MLCRAGSKDLWIKSFHAARSRSESEIERGHFVRTVRRDYCSDCHQIWRASSFYIIFTKNVKKICRLPFFTWFPAEILVTLKKYSAGSQKLQSTGRANMTLNLHLGTADHVCHITNVLFDPGKLTPGKTVELLCKIGFELRPIFGSR